MGEVDKNMIYIINGETSMVIAALKKNTKWSMLQHQDDTNNTTLKDFAKLKETLKNISSINDIKQNLYLDPFLKTISCEDTTGPVTRLALSSLQKFIQYDMIEVDLDDSMHTIDNIAHSLIHAKFIGTDPAADEVVIQKILQVMQTLFFSKLGTYLTDQSVCGILHSFFRIAFEMRFADLLRHYSENALIEIFLMILNHIPIMTYEIAKNPNHLQTSEIQNYEEEQNMEDNRQKSQIPDITSEPNITEKFSELDLTNHCIESESSKVDSQNVPCQFDGLVMKDKINDEADTLTKPDPGANEMVPSCAIDIESRSEHEVTVVEDPIETPTTIDTGNSEKEISRINHRGVLFKTNNEVAEHSSAPSEQKMAKASTLKAYGYSSLNELMRFIINLTNPSEKQINNDCKIVYSLNLLVMAFERRAPDLACDPFILKLVKDRLCKNLIELIKSDKMTIVAASLRLGFNLFKSMKHHLKYQMEMFFGRLADILASEGTGTSAVPPYQKREYILDTMVQFFKVPNMAADLYLNYDCDLYCSNLLEDWTKLLSKNAFPITGIYSVHLLSLEALFAIVDDVAGRCNMKNHCSIGSEQQSLLPPLHISARPCLPGSDSEGYRSGAIQSSEVPESGNETGVNGSEDEKEPPCGQQATPTPSISIKMKKIFLHTGTEHFNTKPSKGIQFLQEAGLLSQPLNEVEVAHFLRENPALDKKMMGEYLSNRKNLGVLQAFVYSFNFDHTRIDQALRMYLEAFRLPGEAPLISLMLENFAHHWHVSNGEPFANEDAAFALAYGIIMLNVDQHHQIVKKQMNPMTCEEFTKNLSKVNGGDNFDPAMLQEIYKAIKSEEIVMPAEQTGTVKDNYLWKLLLRRSESSDYHYQSVKDASLDRDIYLIVWGPTVAASSYIFDKTNESAVTSKIMTGFKKCALIANYYGLSDVLDKLIITLCKFTNVINMTENVENLAVTLGNSPKALLSLRMVFLFARYHGDILSEGWKYIVDTLFQLFRAQLLPNSYVEVDDYLSPTCKISLHRSVRQNQCYEQPDGTTPCGDSNLGCSRPQDYRALYYYTTSTHWPGFKNRAIKKRSDQEINGGGSGLFSSFYSYVFSTSPDNSPNNALPFPGSAGGKEYTASERAAIQAARDGLVECRPENVVLDTKFLGLTSLKELFKTLMYGTDKFSEPNSGLEFGSSLRHSQQTALHMGGSPNLDSGSDYGKDEIDLKTWPSLPSSLVMDPLHEDYLVFNLEILVQIVIQNRDRIDLVWSTVRSYFYDIIVNHSATPPGGQPICGRVGKKAQGSLRNKKGTGGPNATFIKISKASSGQQQQQNQQMPSNKEREAYNRPESLDFTSYGSLSNSTGAGTNLEGAYFSDFLLERAVVGLLRIATRLARRSSIVSRVIGSLRILLMFVNDPAPSIITTPRYHSPPTPGSSSQGKGGQGVSAHPGGGGHLNFYFERYLSPHAACGLAELVRLNCPSGKICKLTDWTVILACLERVGAAAFPLFYSTGPASTRAKNGCSSTFELGRANTPTHHTSKNEVDKTKESPSSGATEIGVEDSGFASTDATITGKSSSDDWLIVKNQDVITTSLDGPEIRPDPARLCNASTGSYDYIGSNSTVRVRLKPHNPFSFAKCCDTLAFLVTGHLSPVNFHLVLATVSTFAEAYVRGRRINGSKFVRAGVAANTERAPLIHGSVMEYLLARDKNLTDQPCSNDKEGEQCSKGIAGDNCDMPGAIVSYYENRPQPNPFATGSGGSDGFKPDHKIASSHKIKRTKSGSGRAKVEIGIVVGIEKGGEAEDENLEDESDTYYEPQGEGSSDSNPPLSKANRLKSVESVDKMATSGSFFSRLRPSSPNPITSEGNQEPEGHVKKGNPKPHEAYRDVHYQILDIMYAMQTQAKTILYKSTQFSPGKMNLTNDQNADYALWISNFLWATVWRPLLKGMARMCCDRRRQVRMTALTYLQRSLLAADLQELSGADWENCFSEVLFPLTSHLLNNDTRPRLPAKDLSGLEETRHRAATLLAKVFLQHLSLLSPPGPPGTGCSPLFTSLWLAILDFMDRFVHVSGDGNDMLAEAIPESLKNMLLVMETSGIFHQDPGLRELTWDRINSFLPKILLEIRFQQQFTPTPPSSPYSTPLIMTGDGQPRASEQPSDRNLSAYSASNYQSEVPPYYQSPNGAHLGYQGPPSQMDAFNMSSPILQDVAGVDSIKTSSSIMYYGPGYYQPSQYDPTGTINRVDLDQSQPTTTFAGHEQI